MRQQRTPHDRPALRRGVATLGLTGGAVVAAALTALLTARAGELVHLPGAWRIESAVELTVTTTGALVTAWLAASAAVALVCVLTRAAGTTWRAGERAVQRFAPAVVRRVLVLGVGASLGLAGATAAGAATHPVVVDLGGTAVVATTPPTDLGWSPTRPDGTVAPSTPSTAADAAPSGPAGVPSAPADAAPPSTGVVPPPSADAAPPSATAEATSPSGSSTTPTDASTAAVGHGSTQTVAATVPPSDATPPGDDPPDAVPPATVVVQPGDSLWGIAARHLPDGADDATVARAWPRWHAANLDVVGADPDVLHPGQVLEVPATGTDVR